MRFVVFEWSLTPLDPRLIQHTALWKGFIVARVDRQSKLCSLYLHWLPATSSSSAVSPAFHALPSPLLPALSSVSPPSPSAWSSLSVLAAGQRQRKCEGRRKKKRKHDGLLSGVNYNSAKPVKEGGSSQTLMKSLSGTTKVRWSFLAALWFKSSEKKKKKKTNFISLNSETRLMRLMHQWSRNQEKMMITSNSVLWLWVVAT